MVLLASCQKKDEDDGSPRIDCQDPGGPMPNYIEVKTGRENRIFFVLTTGFYQINSKFLNIYYTDRCYKDFFRLEIKEFNLSDSSTVNGTLVVNSDSNVYINYHINSTPFYLIGINDTKPYFTLNYTCDGKRLTGDFNGKLTSDNNSFRDISGKIDIPIEFYP